MPSSTACETKLYLRVVCTIVADESLAETQLATTCFSVGDFRWQPALEQEFWVLENPNKGHLAHISFVCCRKNNVPSIK